MKLPRRLTINDRADFQAVRESGRSSSGKYLVLAARAQPTPGHWRYALITTKKVGKAHDRNRIRRLVRAVLVAEGEALCQGYDLVFIARWRAKEATYAQMQREVLNLAKKLKILSAQAPTHEAKS